MIGELTSAELAGREAGKSFTCLPLAFGRNVR